MTRTASKVVGTSTDKAVDTVAVLITLHTDAAREHFEKELAKRAEVDRDITFAFMVTNNGPAR